MEVEPAAETTGWAKERSGMGWVVVAQPTINQKIKHFNFQQICTAFKTLSSTAFLVLVGGWVCFKKHFSINHRAKAEPHLGSF